MKTRISFILEPIKPVKTAIKGGTYYCVLADVPSLEISEDRTFKSQKAALNFAALLNQEIEAKQTTATSEQKTVMRAETEQSFADRLNIVKRLRNYTLENIAEGVTDALKKRGSAKPSITKAAVHRWNSDETEPQNRDMWQAVVDFLNEDLSWPQTGVRSETTTVSQRLARKIVGLFGDQQEALVKIINSMSR